MHVLEQRYSCVLRSVVILSSGYAFFALDTSIERVMRNFSSSVPIFHLINLADFLYLGPHFGY